MHNERIPTGAEQEERIDAIVVAEEIDQQAVENIANRQGTIVSIADEQERLMQLILQTGLHIDGAELRGELQRLQEERLHEIMNDTSAKVAILEVGVAGLYDGKDVLLDINHIDRGVAEHEFQHREDGIDASLDDDLHHETGIRELDDRLKDFGTKRDVLEERAMDAAGEIPEPYRTTHWKTVKDIEKRGRNAGVSMEQVNNQFIETNDEQKLQESILRVAIDEAGKEDVGDLDIIEEQAETSDSSAMIFRIVEDTREKYKNGHESVRKDQQEVLERTGEMATAA